MNSIVSSKSDHKSYRKCVRQSAVWLCIGCYNDIDSNMNIAKQLIIYQETHVFIKPRFEKYIQVIEASE